MAFIFQGPVPLYGLLLEQLLVHICEGNLYFFIILKVKVFSADGLNRCRGEKTDRKSQMVLRLQFVNEEV